MKEPRKTLARREGAPLSEVSEWKWTPDMLDALAASWKEEKITEWTPDQFEALAAIWNEGSSCPPRRAWRPGSPRRRR